MVITSESEILNSFGINYAIQTYYVKDLHAAKNKYKEVSADAIKTITKEKYKAIAFFDKKFHKI